MQIVNVERAEAMIMYRAAAAKVGTVLRLTCATDEIDKLDAGISFVRNDAPAANRTAAAACYRLAGHPPRR